MRKYIILASILLLSVSCQRVAIERAQQYGSLSLQLYNSPVVEVVTKSDPENISTDGFNVKVISTADESVIYNSTYALMPDIITVPVGSYQVSAENVTETVALTGWGQVWYASPVKTVEVAGGINTTPVELTCKMANTALSVVFGENVDSYFTNYTVEAYTTSDRVLVYTLDNTTAETPAVGYFKSGTTLNYVFKGKYLGTEDKTISGTYSLEPAKHLHLTFKMIGGEDGVFGKPELIVDTTCEDVYEGIIVDPSGNGSFIEENN